MCQEDNFTLPVLQGTHEHGHLLPIGQKLVVVDLHAQHCSMIPHTVTVSHEFAATHPIETNVKHLLIDGLQSLPIAIRRVTKEQRL